VIALSVVIVAAGTYDVLNDWQPSWEKAAIWDQNIWTDYVEYKETPEEKAELKKNLLEWEKKSRNEAPKTKPVVRKAVALVLKANSLLKGNPTCSNMKKASKLLDKAGDVYSDSNAKEAGDGTLRTLSTRVSWLEDRAENGWCPKEGVK
jgi:arsenate reductase-like glutaredoxin family protein